MNFPEFLNEWHNEDNFIVVKTSGSTGNPKEITLQKDFLRESAERTNNFFNIDSSSWLHSCVAADFIGGKMMAVRASLAEASFTWEVPSNQPLRLLDPEQEITLLAVVPSQMEFIIDNKDRLPAIKNIIIGGAPVTDKLRIKIAESGLTAFETYGMTETASHIALRKIGEQISPFKTLEGISVALAKDNSLIINLPGGESIETNDTALLLSDREFFITGRKDLIINSGGKKINPIELEKQIASFIDSSFFLSCLPDEKWGEKVVLVIKSQHPFSNEDNAKFLGNLDKILPHWQLPKEIFIVSELPLTENGKIKRLKNQDLLDFLSGFPNYRHHS